MESAQNLYFTPPASWDTANDLLICFSHLRWDFVFQRPQHLMTLAARKKRVIFWEEPVFEDRETPRLNQYLAQQGVWVVCPVLPHGTDPNPIQRQFPKRTYWSFSCRQIDTLVLHSGRC